MDDYEKHIIQNLQETLFQQDGHVYGRSVGRVYLLEYGLTFTQGTFLMLFNLVPVKHKQQRSYRKELYMLIMTPHEQFRKFKRFFDSINNLSTNNISIKEISYVHR